MIQVTESAARRIRALMRKAGLETGGLRVGIKAGGCSGFSYVFAWEQTPRPDDHVFDGPLGVRVFVDPKSHRFLDGTVLDCDTNMLGQSLVLKNPNAAATCGCGASFSV